MKKAAVIFFPGNNCEEETLQVFKDVGMQADLIRWNTNKDLSEYDCFVLQGGFSYEDRIRAGVISAKDPLMQKIKRFADDGKVVLGICNGAQVLIESGLVPGNEDKVQMALAPNINPFVLSYYATFVNIKPEYIKTNAFNRALTKNEIIPIPVSHAEGRFVTRDRRLLKQLIKNKQIAFKYCDEKGKVINKFPVTPNSSMLNIAAITNPNGNVMAIMPHPERAAWLKQLPEHNGNFNQLEKFAPAMKIIESIKSYLEK